MLAYMRLEANAYRWRFNLKTGEVREGDIDDLNTEFNKSNPIFHGVKSKYSTTSAFRCCMRAAYPALHRPGQVQQRYRRPQPVGLRCRRVR